MTAKKWDKKDQRANILYYGVGGRWDVIYKPTGESIGSVRAMRGRHFWKAVHIDGQEVSPVYFHSRRTAAIRLRNNHQEAMQRRGESREGER